ncbi:MAG: Flp pilus assembly protein CpaB [Thermomicrobium sp.]|nr:Flp pilus assembly protein CpaB [Thermomicrobium sp.]MDW7982720.1 Flp pilus assembly protein CpaB [Thermomicrobium sp.]
MARAGRLYLIAGVLLAGVAVLLAVVALQRQGTPRAVEPTVTPSVSVVVAARDLRAGTVLREEDVRTVQADPSSVAPGTAQQPDQVVGFVVAGDLVQGQRILMANLVAPSISALLQHGKRAVAIPVDRINAVGGLVQPNDTVDLVYAGRIDVQRVLPTEPLEMADNGTGYAPNQDAVRLPEPGSSPGQRYAYPGAPGSRVVVTDVGEGQPVAKIVIQKLRVLQVIAGTAVVGQTNPSAQPFVAAESGQATPTPTREPSLPAVDLLIVEADPAQAELITFLLDQNVRYQVVLRARGDMDTVQTAGVTYDRLVEDYGLPVPGPVDVRGGAR